MESWSIPERSPQEQELASKQMELKALESQLAQRELDLATLLAEFHAFENDYQKLVGIRHKALEQIEAQILEYTKYLLSVSHFKPSAKLKQLYREIAKQIHPDLATSEGERQRRQELMAEANQAYEQGDEQRLKGVLDAWNLSPESIQGDGLLPDLMRTARKIAQIRERLRAINAETAQVQSLDLFKLKDRAKAAKAAGRDLLVEMAQLIDDEIAEAALRLEELKNKLGETHE
jgi:DnaJ-domain-containing protein 1